MKNKLLSLFNEKNNVFLILRGIFCILISAITKAFFSPTDNFLNELQNFKSSGKTATFSHFCIRIFSYSLNACRPIYLLFFSFLSFSLFLLSLSSLSRASLSFHSPSLASRLKTSRNDADDVYEKDEIN